MLRTIGSLLSHPCEDFFVEETMDETQKQVRTVAVRLRRCRWGPGLSPFTGEGMQTEGVLNICFGKDRTIDLYWKRGECWWERKGWL